MMSDFHYDFVNEKRLDDSRNVQSSRWTFIVMLKRQVSLTTCVGFHASWTAVIFWIKWM